MPRMYPCHGTVVDSQQAYHAPFGAVTHHRCFERPHHESLLGWQVLHMTPIVPVRDQQPDVLLDVRW
jgi:hypothetical protein